eukprot:5932806-Prymnesium_polylepis.1
MHAPGKYPRDVPISPACRARPDALERCILRRHGRLDVSHHLPHEREEFKVMVTHAGKRSLHGVH